MKRKSLIVFIVAVVVTASSLVGFSMYGQSKIEETPVTHIAYAMTQKDYNAAEGKVTFVVNRDSTILREEVKKETVDYLAELIENVTLTLDYQYDVPEENIDNSNLNFSMGLEYSKLPVISADLYYNNLVVGALSSEILPNGIKMDLNEELKDELDFELKEVKLHDFYQVIMEDDELLRDFKGGYQKYLDVYSDVLGDEFIKTNYEYEDVKGTMYTLELGIEKQKELYKKLSSVMKEDEAMKALVKDRLIGIIDLIDSDYIKYFGDDQEEVKREIKKARVQIEYEFEDFWTLVFEDMDFEEIYSDQTLNENIKSKVQYIIDDKNVLVRIDSTVETPVGNLNQSYTFYEKEDLEIDINTFTDYSEMDTDMEQEIIYNFMGNVLNSEGLKKFRKDISELSTNDETEMIKDHINSIFMGN